MEIEKMNEQQIIEYLRSKSTSSKALGVAKSRTVEDFVEKLKCFTNILY